MIKLEKENLHGKGTSRFFEKVDATEGRRLMDRKRKPGIYLLTDAGDAVELILVWLDGRETRLRGQSPAEELVSFVNFDFSAYRASVERLWEEHDVFEERVEVPYEDYVDFARQAFPLAE